MNIEALLRDWDGESVVVRHDRPSGAWIFIAIHSTRLGPAGGGTRMKTYASPAHALRDAMQLASAMTRKFAVPALPYGGGKAVICIPDGFDAALRPALLRCYGALVRSLGGSYLTGPDVGTDDVDMDTIAETGAPYVFGTSAGNGGASSGAITAAGVFAGLEVLCEKLFGDASLRQRTILVQGAGSVGGRLIHQLCEAGATVLFTDVDAAAAEKIHGARFVPAAEVYDTPCALGEILNAQTIPRLRCRAVAGDANNQALSQRRADSVRDYLIERGVSPERLTAVGYGEAQPVDTNESDEGRERNRCVELKVLE